MAAVLLGLALRAVAGPRGPCRSRARLRYCGADREATADRRAQYRAFSRGRRGLRGTRRGYSQHAGGDRPRAQQGVLMILGIGADLVDIRRIEQVIGRHGERFLNRVFTPTERGRAQRGANQSATYAKRFAAKEACAKA